MPASCSSMIIIPCLVRGRFLEWKYLGGGGGGGGGGDDKIMRVEIWSLWCRVIPLPTVTSSLATTNVDTFLPKKNLPATRCHFQETKM